MPSAAVRLAVLLLALIPVAGARADLISVSATAPTINGDDIAQLAPGGTDAGGDQGHIWFNRPVQGQTFTTLSNGSGYLLNAITLQNLNNNVANNNQPFTVTIGTVTGTVLTPLATLNSTNTITYVPGDYITFNLTTAMFLNPNTVYGFYWDASGSGFVTTNSANSSYTGGEAFSSGSAGVPNDAALVFRGVDRTFHLDIAAVPEPGSVAMMLGALAGAAGLAWRRGRRRTPPAV